MDYNRFVERIRKMYPDEPKSSFEIEPKANERFEGLTEEKKVTPKEQDSKGETL